MKHLLVIATLLISAPLKTFSQVANAQEAQQRILVGYIEQEAKMLEALKATKTEADLEKLKQTISEASKKMATFAKDLAAHGPFDDQTARTLWSVRATREYELLGDASMTDAIKSAPTGLQPKIMQTFQGSMQELEAADEALSESIAKKSPGPGRERIRIPLEGIFVASISTAHKKDPFADPTIAIEFLICTEQLDGSSVVLYEQVIPWSGATPSDEDLKKWIDYSKEKREVTFKHPSGSFSHPLPTKR
jgi:hypothetical protein